MTATATESPYFNYQQASAHCNVERTTPSGPGTAVRFHWAELDRWMDSRNRK